MKDGPISKWIITKTGHKPSQYKKIIDTLPLLCADKNYQGLDDVIWTGNNLVETDFMSTYLDTNQWSNIHDVEIETVNPNIAPEAVTSLRPHIVTLLQKTHVFDANL